MRTTYPVPAREELLAAVSPHLGRLITNMGALLYLLRSRAVLRWHGVVLHSAGQEIVTYSQKRALSLR